MKVLVVAAHPDDEVLGCGGTIARLADDGHDVHIAILGEGITSRYRNRTDADPEEIQALHSSSHKAATVLGARDVTFFNLPDNRFDTIPLLEVAKLLEDLIARVKPEVVYTHHGGDLNMDHVVVARATLIATRPTAGHPVREVYAYEVPSSTEWTFQQLGPVFRPSVFVDIQKTLDRKIEAMNHYRSEVRPFPHPRSAEALQAIARRWGSVVGLEAAEAFEPIRILR